MARQSITDDSLWDEVFFINSYAVFMGYLMMGVRGLGILIITWTTVVLLGGFVSVLGKKDFWCLTLITLIQTVGVFNFLLMEKLNDFKLSAFGLLAAVASTVHGQEIRTEIGDTLINMQEALARFLAWVQAFVLVIILCLVAVLYVFAVYISALLGLWRVIDNDQFSDNNADGGANLKPALEVLYSLAVAQGVIFGYKAVHSWRAKVRLVKVVAEKLNSVEEELVLAYLEDTVAGCEKDPSFATGRNLVTYAVDLMMDARSYDGFIDGVKILGVVIIDDKRMEVAKHLLTRSASSSHLIQRLLDTLNPRSHRHGSNETRKYVLRIVECAASAIHLEQFPGGIQKIGHLLDAFDSNLPHDESKWLVTRHGFFILHGLAIHEDNCRVIINTEGLLPKIWAPLISHELYRGRYDEWLGSLKLLWQLAAISGETGTKLLSEILGREQAIISTFECCILECIRCDVGLKISAVEILLDMSVGSSSITANGSSSRILTWILVFLVVCEADRSLDSWRKKSSDISTLAGEKLRDILSSNLELSALLNLQTDDGSTSTSVFQSFTIFLGDLTKALVDAENISNRVHATKILDLLYVNYWTDDEYIKELNRAMIQVMPEVVREILVYMSTREETQAVTKTNNVPSPLEDTDLESGGFPQGNGQENASSSLHHQMGEQHGDAELRLWEALVSLSIKIDKAWWREPQLLQLDKLAKKVCSEQGKPVNDFSDLLKKARGLLKKENLVP